MSDDQVDDPLANWRREPDPDALSKVKSYFDDATPGDRAEVFEMLHFFPLMMGDMDRMVPQSPSDRKKDLKPLKNAITKLGNKLKALSGHNEAAVAISFMEHVDQVSGEKSPIEEVLNIVEDLDTAMVHLFTRLKETEEGTKSSGQEAKHSLMVLKGAKGVWEIALGPITWSVSAPGVKDFRTFVDDFYRCFVGTDPSPAQFSAAYKTLRDEVLQEK